MKTIGTCIPFCANIPWVAKNYKSYPNLTPKERMEKWEKHRIFQLDIQDIRILIVGRKELSEKQQVLSVYQGSW